MYVYLSLSLSLCLSLPLCLFVCLSIYLPTSLPLYLPIHLSISVSPSLSLPPSLSLSLSVSLSLSQSLSLSLARSLLSIYSSMYRSVYLCVSVCGCAFVLSVCYDPVLCAYPSLVERPAYYPPACLPIPFDLPVVCPVSKLQDSFPLLTASTSPHRLLIMYVVCLSRCICRLRLSEK